MCERIYGMDRSEKGQIRGTNLGNWLVLEKWMDPRNYADTDAADEAWLYRRSKPDHLWKRLCAHRDTYITEADFQRIAQSGLSAVRIPVPYYIFGDRPPCVGCISYLDRAFDWAERYRLKILIDLHTTPGGQNGYDNGGITGVCKWHKMPDEVEFVLSVLERLAERYGRREGLMGIEALNEPISFLVWWTSPSSFQARDKKEARESGFVPLRFLKRFYKDAYQRMRKHLPKEKVIVFHDGFRLGRWKDFFVKSGMKNVMLDTHIYILAMEKLIPLHKMWMYRLFIQSQKRLIGRAQKYTPVIVGEWSLCNMWSEKMPESVMLEEDARRERNKKYQKIAQMELDAWENAAGWFYWNYSLTKETNIELEHSWLDSWDLRRCRKNGWL